MPHRRPRCGFTWTASGAPPPVVIRETATPGVVVLPWSDEGDPWRAEETAEHSLLEKRDTSRAAGASGLFSMNVDVAPARHPLASSR
jgi:hypothetical protein